MGTRDDSVAETGAVGTVGFIGAGQIGAPMVEQLLAAGHRVRVYARRAEVRERMAAAGAELVNRARDIAEADAVVSCLYSDAQMLEVLPEVVRAMDSSTVLLSHTTGRPQTLTRLEEVAAPRKPALVEAPFSGTPEAIRARRLAVYLAGEAEHVAIARKVVSAYADPIIPTGARGSALRVKLLNNLLFAAITQLTLRGIEAGRAMGIQEDTLLEALAVSSGGSNAGRYIVERGGAESFASRITPFLRKDLAACRDAAQEAGVDLSDLLAAAYAGPMNLTDETGVTGSKNGVHA